MNATFATCLPIALLWPAARRLLESSMYMQMLVGFPILLLSGWSVATALPPRTALGLGAADPQGLLALTIASCVGAFWMIPAALDLSLVHQHLAAIKYGSLWLAGLLLGNAWNRMPTEIRVFFLGNAAWMLATAGLLILESEARLCVNYLQDDQVVTGAGLVAAAVAMLCLPLLDVSCRTRPQKA